jgi:hypothetical protein
MIPNHTFDPVKYSLEENQFLLTSLGLAPIVALQTLPASCNAAAVKPILQQVYDLIELERATGQGWTGVETLKSTIEAYLGQAQKWTADKRRGAPRFPSMHSFDSRKRPHRSGPGSDSGQVRSYFSPKGERLPFAVDLIQSDAQDWVPDWEVQSAEEQAKSGLVVNAEANRIECQVCQHTESFNKDSRGSFNAARARMSKHLRLAKDNVDAHREIYTNEFGS